MSANESAVVSAPAPAPKAKGKGTKAPKPPKAPKTPAPPKGPKQDKKTPPPPRPSGELREKARAAANQLKKIADPTRLRIVLSLSEGERNVAAICEEVGMSQPAVSHHLALLRHGGVATPDRRGKENYYGLTILGDQLAAVARTVV